MLGRLPVGGSFAADVLVAAIGMSLSYIPTLIAGLSAVKPEETGLASGIEAGLAILAIRNPRVAPADGITESAAEQQAA